VDRAPRSDAPGCAGRNRLASFDGGLVIYICFGMTKSASTYLYQLIEETFRAVGRKPARLGPPFRPRWSYENYVDDIDPALLEAISATIGERDIVLKTHQGLHPDVGRRINSRSLLASASIRDPREIALAMVDHGRRSRRRGDPEFAECRTIYDAFPSLDNQTANFSRWSKLERIEIFRYNEICFGSADVVARIAAQIGVSIDPTKVLRPFRGQRLIGQFNKGAALRRREMSPNQEAVFLERYAKLYEEFWFDTPAAESIAHAQGRRTPSARTLLAHRVAGIRRLLRS
jgi:hypothetical protein